VFLNAAEKSGFSEMQHQGQNRRLTLCKVLDMSLLDATSLRTFSNKSAFDDVSLAFDDVSPSTFDVSLAFDDVSPLTFDVSPAFEDLSPSTFDLSSSFDDLSSSFDDLSPLTFDVSVSFDDLSLAFDDCSARMSLACPFIVPNNSCRSDSIALLCGAAVSGSELVSVRRPIPCGFEGTVCGLYAEHDALTRPTVYDLRLLTIGFLRATSQLSAALVIRNRKIGHSRHYILFVSFRNLHNIRP
jgi:hypothetical protein